MLLLIIVAALEHSMSLVAHRSFDQLPTDPAELLALEGIDPDGPSVVYLSGSVVEGLANSASDIDLFVVADGAEPRAPAVFRKSRFSVAIHFVGARRIDFEYWPPKEVLAIARRLAAVQPGKEFVAEALDPTDEVFIHRVGIGVPLVNAEGFRKLQAEFDFERFRRYLVQQAVHRLDGALEDLTGMLDDGDLEVALLRARDVVGLAADAFLHDRGFTNTLPKWRARLLAAAGAEAAGVRERFWALQFPAGGVLANEGSRRRYVHCCIEFANRVTDDLQP
jgi:hypothetical protein